MNRMKDELQNNAKPVKPEDPKKIKSKEIGKDLMQAIAGDSGIKAFDIARKRSGSVPAAPVSASCDAGFFALSQLRQSLQKRLSLPLIRS